MRTRWSRLLSDFGGQSVRFGPEQPGRRLGEQLVGVVEGRLAVHRGGQHLQTGRPQLRHGGMGIGGDDDGDREDAAGRGAQALAVVGVDAVSGQNHRRGAHGVGDANQRARVARLADLHGDRDQPR